jgi:hypothetical protein
MRLNTYTGLWRRLDWWRELQARISRRAEIAAARERERAAACDRTRRELGIDERRKAGR